MAKDPAFLFYPGDYLRDTQCLSEQVQVAYDRIMCEHMRKICISQSQLKFFTKKLTPDEIEELKMVLKEVPGGFQIEWVAASIEKRVSYSESRRQNRVSKKDNHIKNTSSSYVKHMENENENENENIIGTEKGKRKVQKGKPENQVMEEINPHPFSIQFLDHWNRWKEFKWSQHKEKYKAIKTEQTAFNHLVKISQSDETKAIELIDFAISKLWKGIYPDNTQDQKNGKPTYNGKQGAAAAISIIANASRAGNKIDWSSFDTTGGGPGMGGTKKPDDQQNPKR